MTRETRAWLAVADRHACINYVANCIDLNPDASTSAKVREWFIDEERPVPDEDQVAELAIEAWLKFKSV